MVVDRELLPLGTAVSGGRGLLRGMEFRVPGNRTAISHPLLAAGFLLQGYTILP